MRATLDECNAWLDSIEGDNPDRHVKDGIVWFTRVQTEARQLIRNDEELDLTYGQFHTYRDEIAATMNRIGMATLGIDYDMGVQMKGWTT
jgi:hypothetical protein